MQDNLRPVIYYLKHMLQDMDEEKMLSRALISYAPRSVDYACFFTSGSWYEFRSRFQRNFDIHVLSVLLRLNLNN